MKCCDGTVFLHHNVTCRHQIFALTKGFSFLGANDSNEAPLGNFEFLNGQGATGTRTASEMPNGGLGARAQQKSKKEDLFDKQMEEYMRQRNTGMVQPPMRQ